MAYCENCGAALELGAVFCQECGHRVDIAEPGSDPSPTPRPYPYPTPGPDPAPRREAKLLGQEDGPFNYIAPDKRSLGCYLLVYEDRLEVRKLRKAKEPPHIIQMREIGLVQLKEASFWRGAGEMMLVMKNGDRILLRYGIIKLNPKMYEIVSLIRSCLD